MECVIFFVVVILDFDDVYRLSTAYKKKGLTKTLTASVNEKSLYGRQGISQQIWLLSIGPYPTFSRVRSVLSSLSLGRKDQHRILDSDTKLSEEAWQYNKFGFCKFRDSSRRYLYQEQCEQEQCKDKKKCKKRCPKICKKFSSHNGCRLRNDCSYKYTEQSSPAYSS